MTVDGISLAVFKNRIVSIAEEMGVTLQRASFSPNIKERLDFSCAVFDGEGRMIAQAAHIPVHLGSMPASVRHALQAFNRFQPGDVVILNDPYHGGTHLPDVTMVSPVFVEAGPTPQFLVASRAHHADVGGMAPGSLPLSTELYQEGIIVPPIKLVEAGQRNAGVLALITANSRTPTERLGDLEAQLAAHRVGNRRLQTLVAARGLDHVVDHAEALMNYSRRMTEAAISGIPAGRYTFEDAIEGDGQVEARFPIRATITVDGPRMVVDFTGSGPQVRGNVNAVEPIVHSATWYCVRLLAQEQEDVPVNHGCFQPVEVIVPPHSLLSPDFPAAVAAANVETSQRIVDVVLGALAQALPDRLPAASQGTMNNVTFGGVVDGTPFVFYETIGGGHGGGPTGNGLSGRHSHMTNTRNTPVEALEHSLPVRVMAYTLRENSGGRGQFRGGNGIRRTFEFLAPATVTVNSERRVIPPYGLQGGEPGKPGVNRLVQAGTETTIGGKATVCVNPGDQLIIETPGGGGWGPSGMEAEPACLPQQREGPEKEKGRTEMSTTIRVRPIQTLEEYQATEAIQKAAWGKADIAVIPHHLPVIFQIEGGLVLGAFERRGDQERLVGFTFGFIGLTGENKPKFCSQITGVLPAYQNQNVGYRLKVAQREHILARGLDLITWTFDPLESRNGRLNVHKLGTVCHTYLRNLYGRMADELNAGLPTDRFRVDWHIASPHVASRLGGKEEEITLATLQAQGVPLISPARAAEGPHPVPPEETEPLAGDRLLVQVPGRFQAIKAADPSLALAWRQHTRTLFETAFEAGYVATDLLFEGGESFYLLERGWKPGEAD